MNSPQDHVSAGSHQPRTGASDSEGATAGLNETAHDLKDKVGQLASEATTEGKARVEEYREVAATKVERLAQSVKAAASELEGDDTGNMSRHIADLAGGMQRLSQGLREKSGDELLRDVNTLARDNPGVFLAAGVAVGFGLTRLLRASASGVSSGSRAGGAAADQASQEPLTSAGYDAGGADPFASTSTSGSAVDNQGADRGPGFDGSARQDAAPVYGQSGDTTAGTAGFGSAGSSGASSSTGYQRQSGAIGSHSPGVSGLEVSGSTGSSLGNDLGEAVGDESNGRTPQ